MCNLPSFPTKIVSVPSTEIVGAITVNPRFVLDQIFNPLSRTTPESVATKIVSGALRATQVLGLV